MNVLISVSFRPLHSFLFAVYAFMTAQTLSAQGTIGFEGFPPDTLPPFIIPVINNPPSGVRVRSGTTQFQAYEGQQYLWAGGTISLQAPGGEAIKSFSFYYFTDPVTPTTRAFFSAGGFSARREDFGKWSLAQGSFETPVESIPIEGIEIEGQLFPLIYRIDAVELELIPEPTSSKLLLCGFFTVLLARKLSRRNGTPLSVSNRQGGEI